MRACSAETTASGTYCSSILFRAASVVPAGDVTFSRNVATGSGAVVPSVLPVSGLQGQLFAGLSIRPNSIPALIMCSMSRKK